jgi:hypothetical protein
MPTPPTLRSFKVYFGTVNTPQNDGTPIVILPPGDHRGGVPFVIVSEWQAPEGGSWKLDFRVRNRLDAPVQLGRNLNDARAVLSIAHDFGSGPRDWRQELRVILLLRQTTTLTFEALIDGEVLASDDKDIEIQRG